MNLQLIFLQPNFQTVKNCHSRHRCVKFIIATVSNFLMTQHRWLGHFIRLLEQELPFKLHAEAKGLYLKVKGAGVNILEPVDNEFQYQEAMGFLKGQIRTAAAKQVGHIVFSITIAPLLDEDNGSEMDLYKGEIMF
jgi:hypothetical protein